MRNILPITLAITVFLGGCEKKDDPFLPIISIDNNVISCKYCRDFGHNILTYRDILLISDHKSVRIFKIEDNSIELIQTIELDDDIVSMDIDESTLAVGVQEYYGTGTVFVYEENVDQWELNQELRIGIFEDAFGRDLEIDGDYMVIGAPAPFGGWVYSSPYSGKIYIYNKSNKEWVLENEFSAEQPKAGDWFGMKVAISGDYILASSALSYINIYKLDTAWGFLRSDTFCTVDMSHGRDTFLYIGGHNELGSFILEQDGRFNFLNINYESDPTYFTYYEATHLGDVKGLLSLVAMHGGGSIFYYLMELVESEWIVNKKLELVKKQEQIRGLILTDKYIILGTSGINNGMSYVSFIEY